MKLINNRTDIISFTPPPAFARGEIYLLSFNAGACRVLLPREYELWIADMQTAVIVHITRQPVARLGLSDGLQLMFDDGTETPFMLHSALDGVIDVLPNPEDHGRIDLICTVWIFRRGKPHRSLIKPATYEDLR